jgi:hypothetical protein
MNEALSITLSIIQVTIFVGALAVGVIKITRKLTFMEADIKHIKENCPRCRPADCEKEKIDHD